MNLQRQESGSTQTRSGTYAIGSVFSGIGGLELGLEMAGVGHTVYQVERDEFCRRQLARNWPGVPQWDDITTVDPRQLPPADVLCGGIPCQETSVANARGNVTGARAGLAGPRSGLWFHMARIVAAQRPRWVIVENVSRGWRKWLPGVERDLRLEGYATLPVPVAARMVGAPHVRERIYLLAYTDSEPVRQHEQRLPRRRPEGLPDWRQEVSLEHGGGEGPGAQPRFSVVDDGIPRGLGGPVWSAIGNSALPQCAEILGHMILEPEGAT